MNIPYERIKYLGKYQSKAFTHNQFLESLWVEFYLSVAYSFSFTSFWIVFGEYLRYICAHNFRLYYYINYWILNFRSNQIYYMFGFLFLVFVILIITCSETTILLCYFHLCAEVSIRIRKRSWRFPGNYKSYNYFCFFFFSGL